MKYRVKYWDGSKEANEFDGIKEAMVAARRGLKDWMNDDDRYYLQHISDHEKILWVTAGSEGETDACARIYQVTS